MIVPVPLHPVKQREREFNQAERLARRLSEARYEYDALDRLARQESVEAVADVERIMAADNPNWKQGA